MRRLSVVLASISRSWSVVTAPTLGRLQRAFGCGALTSCGTPALQSRMRSVEAPKGDRPFRCATPYLQSGGIVLLHTDNVVTIIRGDKR